MCFNVNGKNMNIANLQPTFDVPLYWMINIESINNFKYDARASNYGKML